MGRAKRNRGSEPPARKRPGGGAAGGSGTAPEFGNLLDADRHAEHEDCRPMCSYINALIAFLDPNGRTQDEESSAREIP